MKYLLLIGLLLFSLSANALVVESGYNQYGDYVWRFYNNADYAVRCIIQGMPVVIRPYSYTPWYYGTPHCGQR